MTALRTILFSIVLTGFLGSDRIAAQRDDFQVTVRPILQQYCFKCHGTTDEKRGDVDLLSMSSPERIDAEFEIWETVVELVKDGAMPPQDQPQLTSAEKATLADWYQERFVRSVKPHPGFFRPRRLSAHEYRNTLHSLLGFELEVAVVEAEQTVSEQSLIMKLLPLDPPGESGFRNDTSGNPLTTVLWDQYSYLADNGLERLFSPQQHEALESCIGPIDGDHLSKAQARQLLQNFAERAYRRPVPQATLERPLAAIEAASAADIESTLRVELKAILMSPVFLYRGLLMDVPRDVPTAVDEFELAERLSYFLWADMPDQELLQLAKEGRLSTPEIFHAQIDRLLTSPRARNLAEDLGAQWFSLDEIDHVSDNPPVADALKSQPIDFLNYLFTEQRPLEELISSRITFVNPHTAKFYPRDRGQMTRYRKQKGIEVEIVPNQMLALEQTPERGGLLTMPGILAMNRGPVQRGTWVLERILGEELPDPPADVGQVPGNQAGEHLTFRQRFELHRSADTCAVCHDRIDPIGFALQAYDTRGAYVAVSAERRKSESDDPQPDAPTIDTSGQLPSGEAFHDFTELREILITSQRDRMVRNIVQRMMSFALCRKLKVHDRPAVDAIVADLNSRPGTFRDLTHLIADSLPFRRTVVRSAQEPKVSHD